MACKGTCTVRIFEAQKLTPQSWPPYIDETVARRVLNGVVEKETQEEKETGCDTGDCRCVPLADYLPDETGARKKAPEWTAWRLRNVIDNIGSDGTFDLVVGTVETRSAIVPGLCEKDQYVHLHLPKKASGSNKQEGKKPMADLGSGKSKK